MSKKKRHYVVVSEDGPPCPRCGQPTQAREHDRIRERHLRQPYYFTRWYCCLQSACPTTLIMLEQFKVLNTTQQQAAPELPFE
jgi:hypothetical protein